ncbi:hypothetical protein MANES_08G082211v8 [Manihot esculenta]|uniref:Uncharacterized protein n=1 Tax=Manihot esculenta TaxID=3983 RepID=A0ACB7H9E1_MANES|nr:hypothetical protein MANES_08G082211v8 [Manihot esculenta]
MVASLKLFCLVGLNLLVSIAGGVDGAGECGKSSPDNEALKLAPCAEAAQNENAAVSDGCCLQVKRIGQNTSCESGIKPEIAITIPKRCNIASRPVGYKCGAYMLP